MLSNVKDCSLQFENQVTPSIFVTYSLFHYLTLRFHQAKLYFNYQQNFRFHWLSKDVRCTLSPP